MLLLDQMLTFLALQQTPNIPLPYFVALPHQQQDKQKRKNFKTCHHTIRPLETHQFNPWIDVESHRESKANSIEVQRNGGLCWVSCEYLTRVARCTR